MDGLTHTKQLLNLLCIVYLTVIEKYNGLGIYLTALVDINFCFLLYLNLQAYHSPS